MFSLNLNYRFVFESIYVKSKHTYTDYETRRYNKTFRHREDCIGTGSEVWEVTQIQAPLPWNFVEIGWQDKQGNSRNPRLFPCLRIPVATGIQGWGHQKALEVKSVQRHKPILNKEEHEKAVRKAVSENRESLKSAKAAFEKET